MVKHIVGIMVFHFSINESCRIMKKEGSFTFIACLVGGMRGFKASPQVIKLFSCSTQLSMKNEMLINTQIAKINGTFRF